MAPKPFAFTIHAKRAIAERDLAAEWIEDTVRKPDWVEADPTRPGVERRFRIIPDYGGRVLRAAVVENDVEIRILTVFFDRKARRS